MIRGLPSNIPFAPQQRIFTELDPYFFKLFGSGIGNSENRHAGEEEKKQSWYEIKCIIKHILALLYTSGLGSAFYKSSDPDSALGDFLLHLLTKHFVG